MLSLLLFILVMEEATIYVSLAKKYIVIKKLIGQYCNGTIAFECILCILSG